MKNNKKSAAMFGLDARIALAIFGALSVITGAALYSVIEKARATKLLTNLQELGKSIEAYYLDTNKLLSHNEISTASDGYYILRLFELVEKPSNTTNWQGPYTSLKKDETHSFTLDYPEYNHVNALLLRNDETWGDDVRWPEGGKCTSGYFCSIWVEVVMVDNDNHAKVIDKILDNGDGGKKGNFRWGRENPLDSNSWYHYFLKVLPVKNPHD